MDNIYLLGIDIGTTSLKACLFNDEGNLILSHTEKYDLITDGNFIELNADKYYEMFLKAYNEIAKNYKISALAIDSQGETLILCNENGKPLRNAIVWLDTRASLQAEKIETHFGIRKVYEMTGQPQILSGLPAPKLLWIKENEPEIFSKIKKIFLIEDYIIYKLTGKFATDRTLQSSSLYLDITDGGYWKEMLDFIGLKEEQLPRLYESGEYVGDFNGVKIITGAMDQIAGIIGAGITETGIISEMTGTAMVVCTLTDKIPPYYNGINIPCQYFSKNKYCLMLWSSTGGMALQWFKDNFCENYSFKEIDDLAEKIDIGSEGLTMLPYFCGSTMPKNKSETRGAFYGLELKYTRGHFARSIMEAVACMLKEYIDCLNLPISEIRSTGGGSKSPLWLQIKADVTGKKIVTLKNKEAGCLGSAILVGAGVKIFTDVSTAAKILVKTEKEYKPGVNDYSRVYRKYKELDNLLN